MEYDILYRVMNEVIAHTKIFNLIRKDEVMPGFRPVGLDAPDWVTVIAEKDGKFLMTKQLRFGLMKEVEEFVCGTVDDGEDPKTTARRELQEETGYTISEGDITFLGKVAPNPAFLNNFMYIFYVNLDQTFYIKKTANPGEHERLTSKWMPKESVVASVSCDDATIICPAMKLCALALYKNYIKKNK